MEHRPVSSDEKVIVERGGWGTRMKHRAQLREYSYRIYVRQISYAELKDYLAKGGNPAVLSDYGADNPVMDDVERPLLNYFISGKSPFQAYRTDSADDDGADLPPPAAYETDQRPDRLQSLKLLLDNGAHPDIALDVTASNFEDASPLLWASWLGDVGAMRLLIEYGADINQVQKNIHFSSGAFGPPLLLAQTDTAADLIFQHKPKLDIVVSDGRNIVQELVLSTNYSSMESFVLKKLTWFQKNNITFNWPSGSPDDPLKTAYARKQTYESKTYSSPNPYLPPGPERARHWEEIAAKLEAIKAP